jgi:hypothetical protein
MHAYALPSLTPPPLNTDVPPLCHPWVVGQRTSSSRLNYSTDKNCLSEIPSINSPDIATPTATKLMTACISSSNKAWLILDQSIRTGRSALGLLAGQGFELRKHGRIRYRIGRGDLVECGT